MLGSEKNKYHCVALFAAVLRYRELREDQRPFLRHNNVPVRSFAHRTTNGYAEWTALGTTYGTTLGTALGTTHGATQ